jgi:hypothetical protein
MPVTHDNWPGTPGVPTTRKTCRRCGAPYCTLNPRTAKLCPECRKSRNSKAGKAERGKG